VRLGEGHSVGPRKDSGVPQPTNGTMSMVPAAMLAEQDCLIKYHRGRSTMGHREAGARA
jgi:hypothetical protein